MTGRKRKCIHDGKRYCPGTPLGPDDNRIEGWHAVTCGPSHEAIETFWRIMARVMERQRERDDA